MPKESQHFIPETNYESTSPEHEKARSELHEKTAKALTALEGNYKTKKVLGTIKILDSGFGVRIRNGHYKQISKGYDWEQVRIFERRENILDEADSKKIPRNYVRVGFYDKHGKIKKSGWIPEEFVDVAEDVGKKDKKEPDEVLNDPENIKDNKKPKRKVETKQRETPKSIKSQGTWKDKKIDFINLPTDNIIKINGQDYEIFSFDKPTSPSSSRKTSE